MLHMKGTYTPMLRSFQSFSFFGVLSFFVLGSMAEESSAQNDPSAYCTAGTTCNITADIEVTDGSNVDFGDRIVNLSGILSVRDGSMTLQAAELRIISQGQLNGARGAGGGSFTIMTDADIRIDGARTSGAVQLSGEEGGTLTLRSTAGRIFGAGRILARSQDLLGDGGAIDVMTGGSVDLTGRIEVVGGAQAGGGDVDVVAAGDVRLSGLLDLQGGEDGGGSLSIDSGAAVTLGEVQLDGQGELGDAGSLDVTAESVSLSGRIRGRGSNNLDCGDSAELTVEAGGQLDVAGEIDVNSRRDCVAGTLDFSAAVVSLRSPIKVRAEGSDGTAGSVEVVAAERIECLADVASIDGRGNDRGGSVSFEVDALEPAVETIVDCDTNLTGPQGNFEIDANTNVTINGAITVGSSAAEPTSSPVISVEGCTVQIGAAAVVSSGGGSASNLLVAREQMNVAGRLEAAAANELRFRPEVEPSVTGQVVPAPTFFADDSLQSCGFKPGTPTFTRTATITRTPTPTPTPPIVCVGDCNEDGTVSVDELVLGINISLGDAMVFECPPLDRDQNGQVDISENVTAVGNSLNDCAIVR